MYILKLRLILVDLHTCLLKTSNSNLPSDADGSVSFTVVWWRSILSLSTILSRLLRPHFPAPLFNHGSTKEKTTRSIAAFPSSIDTNPLFDVEFTNIRGLHTNLSAIFLLTETQIHRPADATYLHYPNYMLECSLCGDVSFRQGLH